MTPAVPRGSPELHAAVTAEVAAAEQLADALDGLRHRAEVRDGEGLESALERARCAAAGVTRAGAERLRCTAALARTLGLVGEAPLTRVAAATGDGLAAAAERLRERLQGVAQKSAALGICARFGAVSCERLQDLRRAACGRHAGYGANGRLGGSWQGLGRRA